MIGMTLSLATKSKKILQNNSVFLVKVTVIFLLDVSKYHEVKYSKSENIWRERIALQ